MPGSAAHPLKRNYYVYQFKVDGYPFYVGIGHSLRAPDRLRYVRSLTPVKLRDDCLNNRVIAALDKRGKPPGCHYTKRRLNRRQALVEEKKQIARLLRQGFLLTNWQHNPRRHKDVRKAVAAIMSKHREIILR